MILETNNEKIKHQGHGEVLIRTPHDPDREKKPDDPLRGETLFLVLGFLLGLCFAFDQLGCQLIFQRLAE